MKPIRVLIVEDSITQREILCRILSQGEEFTVVGEARDGAEAVKKSRELSPDVLLMDVHLDGSNGIEATEQIMRDNPLPIVIMSSTLRKRDIDLAVEALRVGAVEVIEKPKGAALLHLSKMAPKLRQVLCEAAVTSVRKSAVREVDKASVRLEHYQPPAQSTQVIGVCVSAGGPSVLVRIFSALPAGFPIPIVLVQHISAGFEEGFAIWLTRQTGQTARIASDGQRLTSGIWLGPTGQHIVLKSPRVIGLLPKHEEDIHCPAGDPMLSSLAEQHGTAAVGVVLTGMGDDGARGLLALKRAGGQTIIQNEATSMVWGMPRAAMKAGAHDYAFNPAEIAAALRRLVR